MLRLAARAAPREWERVIERRLERGARGSRGWPRATSPTSCPGMDTPVVRARARRAHGSSRSIRSWIARAARRAARGAGDAAAILARLARPDDDTLAAADALAQEWWTRARAARARTATRTPPAPCSRSASRSRTTSSRRRGPPTPIAGAYRHIATEALHLVRRSRYQIEPRGDPARCSC